MYALVMVVALSGSSKQAYIHDTLYDSPESCHDAAQDIGLVVAQVVPNVAYIGYQCSPYGEQV
tara:strand:- start:124 stop:312 length:189 start_codon:yes stop_codon:yes gene_type:complete